MFQLVLTGFPGRVDGDIVLDLGLEVPAVEACIVFHIGIQREECPQVSKASPPYTFIFSSLCLV